MSRRPHLVLLLLVCLAPVTIFAQQKTILFDAKHAQTAGNADWTLDEDSCGVAQRYPTPDQAGITASTAETYWSGAFSAMGVDLVKKGFHVESLPTTARISYGDATNAQDLQNYNIFVIPEPNVAFTSAEITAVRSFVQNGGGLFMIADHAGADRTNDGIAAPGVFNQLMGSPSIFGIVYNDNSADKTFGWFDNHPDDNYTSDTTSPIVWTGTFGVPSSGRGLGLFGSTTMTLSGAAKGHVWKTGVSNTSTSGVTFATSTYGTGRVGTSATLTVTVSNSTGSTQLLGNPGFENGSASPAPWTVTTGVIDNSTGEAAHGGSWKAWMDGYGSAHTDSIVQTVAIPSGKTSATLTFWLHVDTAETTTTTAYDTLKVQVRNSSGTVLATLATYSNLNANSGYAQKSFSLNAYIGQTIQVYLVGTEDASLQTSFVVDDFALNVQ